MPSPLLLLLFLAVASVFVQDCGAEDADGGLYLDVRRDVNTSDCLRTLQLLAHSGTRETSNGLPQQSRLYMYAVV